MRQALNYYLSYLFNRILVSIKDHFSKLYEDTDDWPHQSWTIDELLHADQTSNVRDTSS